MKWIRWTVLAAFLGFVAYTLSTMRWTTEEDVKRREDCNNLRQLADLLVRSEGGKLPMKDGALDVYRLVRRGDLAGANLKILGSNRSGPGPTGEEVVRADYTNFPWERYRGDGNLDGPPFPLLWEKEPDENGGRLVALSDGSARYCGREEAEAILRPR